MVLSMLGPSPCHPSHLRHPPLPPTHQYEYPDRYEAEDAAPVGDDSNLLAQPEVLPGPGRLAGYTPGDGRSSFASPT